MSFKIAGCFGVGDQKFAGHPMDKERAFEYLKHLRENSIGWEAAKEELEKYLNSKTSNQGHINEQLNRAEEMLSPWLDD